MCVCVFVITGVVHQNKPCEFFGAYLHCVLCYFIRKIHQSFNQFLFGSAYCEIKKCNFVTQNHWYQFVDLLISSFVPKLFSFPPEPRHPNFCTWLAARLSITHLPTCDWPVGDDVIQRQPPLLPDEEEIPNTDNFYNQIKSHFRKYSHNETHSRISFKSSLEDGVRSDGRVRTVKPWLIVIVPWSSSSGHVDSSVSAFVNIIRRLRAAQAQKSQKCHYQYVKQSIVTGPLNIYNSGINNVGVLEKCIYTKAVLVDKVEEKTSEVVFHWCWCCAEITAHRLK